MDKKSIRHIDTMSGSGQLIVGSGNYRVAYRIEVYQEFIEVQHVRGTVLDAHKKWFIQQLAEGVQFEAHLGVTRHIVKKKRRRHVPGEVCHVLCEIVLMHRKVVGSRQHYGISSALGSEMR